MFFYREIERRKGKQGETLVRQVKDGGRERREREEGERRERERREREEGERGRSVDYEDEASGENTKQAASNCII